MFEYFFGYLGNWVFNVKGLDVVCVDFVMFDLLCWYGVEEVEYCIVVFDIFWYMGGMYFECCFYMLIMILLLLYFLVMGFCFMYKWDLGVGKFFGFVCGWWYGLWCNCLLLFWKMLGVVLCYFWFSYMLYYEGLIE